MDTASSDEPEHFIPYRRADVIEMCIADGGLNESEQHEFRELCEILTAYLHFDFLATGQEIKNCYASFNPDRDTRKLESKIKLQSDESTKNTQPAQVVELLSQVAERANYSQVSLAEIEEYLNKSTLIDLSTRVDLNDFEHVACFARGNIKKEITVKKWWFWTKEESIETFQRVVLLLKYKDKEYYQSSKKKKKELKEGRFVPGAMYAYFYKDVPKYDLELLFPNVQVGMNLRQKLMFAIPALGASIGVLIKSVPQLLIILAVILFLIGQKDWVKGTGVEEDQIRNFMPVMTAILALVIAVGGLAFRQWSSYRKKQLKFLKDVGEQLFFRNLATNRSVFSRLIESAEEEESKEMILVLYHLLKHADSTRTKKQLDQEIESWMKDNFETVIDFDIEGPIKFLSKLKLNNSDGTQSAVIERTDSDHLKVTSLNEAKRIIDGLWDNAFHFFKA